MRPLLLAFVVACSAKSTGSTSPSSDLGCKVIAADQAHCEGQGSGFVYGLDPLAGCHGTPMSDAERKKIQANLNARPCTCMSRADYDERQDRCAEMP